MIVPVYGVERYLRECLDSLLASGGPIEVIAVDDASPDGCAAILAEYATSDARLRVVTHAQNAGVSAARNTGVAEAAGDYIWYVDPDDWLTPGAVELVLDRIRRTTPDVLVVGYERSYWDGRRTVERLVAPGPALPETFTAQDQPRILTTLTLACNKVIRREFLAGLGLQWGSGWYEDVAYTMPLLLAADRIGVIEQVCYGYRQRAEGATTSTRSRRHTEAFDQWQHVMTFAADPALAEFRPLIFQRMILHYLGVLNHPSRIVRSQRREFFARIVADYRRLRPAEGYPSPGGVASIMVALVARNAFVVFEVLRGIYRARTVARSSVAGVAGAARRVAYWWQRHRPLRPRTVVYASGQHDGYPGSPYARAVPDVLAAVPLAEAAAPTLVVGDPLAAEGHPARSWPALRAFARCRRVVADAPLPSGVVLRPDQEFILLPPAMRGASVPAQRTGPASPVPPATAVADYVA